MHTFSFHVNSSAISPQNPSGSETDFSYICLYCTTRDTTSLYQPTKRRAQIAKTQLISSSYILAILHVSLALKLLRREEVIGINSLQGESVSQGAAQPHLARCI